MVRRFAAASKRRHAARVGSVDGRISAGRGLSPAAEAVVGRHLEWPLEIPENREVLARFGTKGGSLPGIVNEASHLTPRESGRPLAVALFLRDLPPDVERDLGESFAQQALILALATDPAFLARARRTLAG